MNITNWQKLKLKVLETLETILKKKKKTMFLRKLLIWSKLTENNTILS